MDTAMLGRICLITGATAGIGEVTARELANKGATVVVVSRSADKCAATVARIQAETQNPNVDFITADMSSQKSIRALAAEFKQRYNHLHVLINNAGALYGKREESVDGIEMTLALNHMGYFLLTQELLDVLKRSAPARVLSVSSEAQRVGKVNFDDIEGKRKFSAWQTYGQSKLCNVLFTYALAKRLAGSGVTANCLHPGFVASSFGHNNLGLFGQIVKLSQIFAINKESGARTSIYLASAPELEKESGKYFVRCKPARSVKLSYDLDAQERLWKISEGLLRP